MSAGASTAWSHGVLHKISRLASARILTQLIGVSWFVVAARVLDSGELGVMAAGLVTFGVVSVVGDLGTTWSIAREVTADSLQAWPLYRQGVVLRVVGVVVIGLPVLGVGFFLVEDRVWLAMQIGVLVALVSGITEIGMTTLRAVGSVRTESIALPAERVGFVILAGILLAVGRGANAILGAYLLTNLVTAAIAYRQVRVHHHEARPEVEARLWSAETRRTGVAFAVLALGPRANALMLVLVATRLEVADYSVAARPVEQFALAVIGLSTTMLPLLRHDAVSGRSAGLRAGAVGATVGVIALPGIVWAIGSPGQLIDLAFGAGRYPGAATVLAVVVLVSISWPLRGLAGMVMVADSQATQLAVISVVGLGANIALAIPLMSAYGAQGAAWALVIADVATMLVLLARSSMRLSASQASVFGRAGVMGIAAGLIAIALPLALGMLVVGAGAVGAGYLAFVSNRRMSRSEEVMWR